MAPPKFNDLGKKAKDLFTEDYIFGEQKLTLKSKANNGVNFKVEGKKTDKGVSGFIETKFAHSSGVTLKEKWSTSNEITAELSLENRPKGSKYILEPVFSPNTGPKSLTFKAEYSLDSFSGDASVNEKQVTVGGVFQYNKYVAGAKVDYDYAKGSVAATRLGAGFIDNDLTVSSLVTRTNVVDIEGAVHLAHSPTLETGVKFSWRKDTADTGFEIGAKSTLDSGSWLKAKVDKNLNVGLSYCQTLRPGVSLILSSKINAGQLNSDSHQVGFGLTFDN